MSAPKQRRTPSKAAATKGLRLTAANYLTSVAMLTEERERAVSLHRALRMLIAMRQVRGVDVGHYPRWVEEVAELILQLDRVLPAFEALVTIMQRLESTRRLDTRVPGVHKRRVRTKKGTLRPTHGQRRGR